ncbi:MAG: molybdopterin-synthase adenylyltransferase MoeB [Litoreibacter sp.]|nr:molybdopterin-synthase adenylyltransferase MoeB [Litoreibacter sp.]MCY4336641.1 molybdopterin-synthase adenylyltransferase MoeB [Litoreibacter sp.]
MIIVLGIMAGLYLLGRVMGASQTARLMLPGLVSLAVLLIQATLPAGNTLKEATGGSLQNWLIILGVAVLVLAYRFGLSKLRARHDETEAKAAPQQGPFSEAELDRYARHIVLREVGGPGQKKLKDAKVLVVGAGGLGAPALQYLAAAGVGTIGIIDDDIVSVSNLQRQVIHRDADLGRAKVASATDALKAQNPHIAVLGYTRRLEAEIAEELIAEYDLVLDGSDNFDTRYLVNAACVAAGVPLVSAAITQWEGQISLYDPANGAPCYACVFPKAPDRELVPTCAEAGVIGALPGVVGSMMAAEAIKWITGAGETLSGRLLIYDALYAETRVIKIAKRDDCETCGLARG